MCENYLLFQLFFLNIAYFFRREMGEQHFTYFFLLSTASNPEVNYA